MIASMIVYAFFFFQYSVQNTYIPIHGRRTLDLSDSLIASFDTYRSLSIMFVRLSSIVILKKISPKVFLVLMLVVSGITGVFTPFTQNYYQLAVVMRLFGACHGSIALLGDSLSQK